MRIFGKRAFLEALQLSEIAVTVCLKSIGV
jgi:hypothetical protein